MFDAVAGYLTPLGERSLRDVYEQIAGDHDLPEPRRRDWLRALKRLARYLGKDLSHLPARPIALRHGLEQLDWGGLGISRKSVQNLRSEIKAVLRHIGANDFPDTRGIELSPAWQWLWDRLLSDRHKRGLTRFVRYCSAKDIVPEEVNDVVVEAFIRAAADGAFVRKPSDLHKQVCRLWNEAAAEVPGWPQACLTVPDFRRPARSLPWDAFPDGFREDVEAYLKWLSGTSLIEENAPKRRCKPSTIRTRRQYVHLAASAAVHGDVPATELKGLADLVNPETALVILEQYLADSGDETPSTFVIDLSGILVSIAARWCGADLEDIAKLKEYRSRLEHHRRPGLTEKNLALIRKVMDPMTRRRLQTLPQRLIKRARAEKAAHHKAAVLAQFAVAIEILLVAPMRVGNLCGLELGTSLLGGPEGPFHIAIAAADVKNDLPLEDPLPDASSELVALYRREFRGRLKGAHTNWLFPGEDGKHKAPRTLSEQVTERIECEIGLKITPHQFRHAAAAWLLQADPGNYELARRLLGHQRLQTTINFYVGLEQRSAIVEYQRRVLGFREEVPAQ